MEQIKRDSLVPVFLNFGEAMMACGAEISRVEDSLSRIGSSFGAVRTEVFAITASLVLTLRFEDAEFTGTRRIGGSGETDFTKLKMLNDLSRECVDKHLSLAEFESKLQDICRQAPMPRRQYLGSAVAAGAFAVFFGGGVWDGIFSACLGILVCFFQRKIAARFPNQDFFLFAVSFLTGCCAVFLSKALFFLPMHIDKIIIGDIMLTVPGIATTMAVRDMLIGDTISGVTKLLECLLRASCLAAGFILALLICGR